MSFQSSRNLTRRWVWTIWGGILGRIVQNSIIIYLVRLLTGSLMLGTAVVQGVQPGQGEHEVKGRIRQNLKERLIGALREQVDETRAYIEETIGERFREFGAQTVEGLGEEIESVRMEQERILRQRRDESFSVESEKRRLEGISKSLEQLEQRLAV